MFCFLERTLSQMLHIRSFRLSLSKPGRAMRAALQQAQGEQLHMSQTLVDAVEAPKQSVRV